MIRKVYIYILTDPTTGRVGYVGKTKNKYKREWEHIRKEERVLSGVIYKNARKPVYKQNWVRSLLKKGITPIMDIIDTVSISEWKEKEIFYVKKFKEDGHKLTNLTKGGDEGSDAAKKKVAKIDYITNDILEIYESIVEAAEVNGHKSRSRISACCSGITQTSGGYKWRLVDEEKQVIEPKERKTFWSRKIGQFDIEMNLIKIYPTLTSTHDYAAVHNVCQGKIKSSNGYIWRYLTNKNEPVHPEVKYKRKTIAKYTLSGEYVRSYIDSEEAARDNGLTTGECIVNVCKNHIGKDKKKHLTAAGYKWKYNNY